MVNLLNSAFSNDRGVLPSTIARRSPTRSVPVVLGRRVAASDVGDPTLTGIERAVDRLAIAYQAPLRGNCFRGCAVT